MKWLWSLALLAVVCVSQARAEVIRTFQVGPWDMAAYADSGGSFSHCAAGVKFNSGATLLFSVNKSFVWTIAFHKHDWGFEPGQQVALALAVDKTPAMKLRGEAFDRSGIVITLDDDADLFKRFRAAKRIKLSGAKQSFEFDVTRMNEMLTKLLLCAKQNDGGAKVAENPFITTKRSNPEFTAEATAFAANLLSDVKMAGYRFLAPDEKPSLVGDARWIIEGAGLGSVRVFPDIDLDAQRTLTRQLVAQEARACEGKFGSGVLPDDEKGPGSAFVMCDIGETTSILYYFMMPRIAGGAYLVTTGYLGGPAAVTQAKEQHKKFREAVFAAK